ncbi:MAG: hypothetical protein LBQ35_00685 [Spirochaetaceae bacterium]|jgi:hypothetical protein|nr:hypothetical protein [Spirochaetaceae bacterium]
MKTVQEYMNDPRITNDPGLMDAPESVREVHAIRLMLQERRVNMTPEERRADIQKRSDAFLAGCGTPLQYVSFPGQGKLNPRQPVTQ